MFVFACSLSAQVEDSKPEPSADAETKKAAPVTTANDTKLFWVFLTTGKSTKGVEKEEVEKMQAEHLANFKRLAEEEKLLLAGPLADPEKKLRGIVVLKAKNQNDLEKMVHGGSLRSKGIHER